MKSVVFFILIFNPILSIPVLGDDSGLRAPPHISEDPVAEYNAKVKDNVKIDCPVDSHQTGGPVYYDWTKDGETITAAWDRFRVSPESRKLRIKDVQPEDSGIYICKAVNGFGSTTISTKLVIFDEKGLIVGPQKEPGSEGIEEIEEFESGPNEDQISSGVVGMRPVFTEITKPPYGQTFRNFVGSSLSLKCKVDGFPTPLISWLKDGVHLPRATGETFNLTAINFHDYGTYQCLCINEFGQINTSFTLEVIERGLEGPEIISLEPSNLTVQRDKIIHFQCHISSNTQPNVQWLMAQIDSANNDAFPEPFQIGMAKYRPINTASPMVSLKNGSYLSELRMNSNQSGSIICLATNAEGYNFQKSHLTVLQSHHPYSDGESDAFPLGILLVIPATTILIFIVLGLVICCVRRCHSNPISHHTTTTAARELNGTLTTNSTYATPRDFLNNHQQSPTTHNFHNNYHKNHHPFYNPRHSNGANTVIPNRLDYFCQINTSPIKNSHSSNYHNNHHTNNYNNYASPAYASVPIFEPNPQHIQYHNNQNSHPQGQGFVNNSRNPPPPLPPSRPNFITQPTTRDRNNFNNHGLSQPLLTQTASSSDSRDSRQSASFKLPPGMAEFPSARGPPVQQCVEQWTNSAGSDGSSADHRKYPRNVRL